MLFLFKLILLMYNVFCMILPTMNFFHVCEMWATVCYVCVVHIVWTQDWWRPIYHFSFSWGYALYKKPIFLADLFPMCLRCFFQTEFSLSFSCLISWLLIIKFSNRRGILSVLIGFGIKKYLAFLMFRDSFTLASTWLLVNAYFYGCIRDLHRLQTT